MPQKDDNYIAINKNLWNQKVAYHLKSNFYDVPGFLEGKNSLNSIELDLLGDISGKRILHLQCHFGQDTLSLARMGAIVTGIDLSDKAIDQAKLLAQKVKVDANFICCDIYDLPNHLNKKFDIVFTSYGTIGWLPDLHKWGKIISQFLNPKGKFIFAEFHPIIWMFDDHLKNVKYRYFNSGAIVETETGTYADKSSPLEGECITWNHSISEVINSLLSNNLELKSFNEYDYSPYDCFNHTIEYSPNKFRIKHLENKIPMVYTLVAMKK